jgi:hypothetical protein
MEFKPFKGGIGKDQVRQSVSGSIGWFMDVPHRPFYNKHGEPMSEVEWSERVTDPSYQRITYTKRPAGKPCGPSGSGMT